MRVDSLTMILRDMPYNRKLDSKNGVYYDENGHLHIDENRCVVDEEEKSIYEVHECIWNNSDCAICTENHDRTIQTIRISPLTSKMSFEFERQISHTRGACWTNWLDLSV